MASQVDSHQLLTMKRGKERDQKKSNTNKPEKRGEKERWADRGFAALETDRNGSASEGERRTCWTDASFSPSQQSPPERKRAAGRGRGGHLVLLGDVTVRPESIPGDDGPNTDQNAHAQAALAVRSGIAVRPSTAWSRQFRRRSKRFPATFSKMWRPRICHASNLKLVWTNRGSMLVHVDTYICHASL